MISRNDLCWCGSGKKWKKCHYPTTEPLSSVASATHYLKQWGIILKTEQQIQGIKIACQYAAKILDLLCLETKAGRSTLEIEELSRELHKKYGVIPADLGYGDPPYPFTICTSINDVICHGFPDGRTLRSGDIINIDVSCIADGYFGDTSRMVVIENIDDESRRVVDVSYESLQRAIAILKPGVFVSEIGRVIESYATAEGCSVVNQFVGHGTGLHFHEAPDIPHHYNQLHIPLTPGMTFTIEPMINAGVRNAKFDPNKWTARTADGKPSAQWEHTLLITEAGCEILTNIH
jgi:methionyl aminopeptidase